MNISVLILFLNISSFIFQKIRTTPSVLYFAAKSHIYGVLSFINFEFLILQSAEKSHQNFQVNGGASGSIQDQDNEVIVLNVRVNEVSSRIFKVCKPLNDLHSRVIIDGKGSYSGKVFCSDFMTIESLKKINKNGLYSYKGSFFGKLLCCKVGFEEFAATWGNGEIYYSTEINNIIDIKCSNFNESQLVSTISAISTALGFWGNLKLSLFLSVLAILMEFFKGLVTLFYTKCSEILIIQFKHLLTNSRLNDKDKVSLLNFLKAFSRRWDCCSRRCPILEEWEGLIYQPRGIMDSNKFFKISPLSDKHEELRVSLNESFKIGYNPEKKKALTDFLRRVLKTDMDVNEIVHIQKYRNLGIIEKSELLACETSTVKCFSLNIDDEKTGILSKFKVDLSFLMLECDGTLAVLARQKCFNNEFLTDKVKGDLGGIIACGNSIWGKRFESVLSNYCHNEMDPTYPEEGVTDFYCCEFNGVVMGNVGRLIYDSLLLNNYFNKDAAKLSSILEKYVELDHGSKDSSVYPKTDVINYILNVIRSKNCKKILDYKNKFCKRISSDLSYIVCFASGVSVSDLKLLSRKEKLDIHKIYKVDYQSINDKLLNIFNDPNVFENAEEIAQSVHQSIDVAVDIPPIKISDEASEILRAQKTYLNLNNLNPVKKEMTIKKLKGALSREYKELEEIKNVEMEIEEMRNGISPLNYKNVLLKDVEDTIKSPELSTSKDETKLSIKVLMVLKSSNELKTVPELISKIEGRSWYNKESVENMFNKVKVIAEDKKMESLNSKLANLKDKKKFKGRMLTGFKISQKIFEEKKEILSPNYYSCLSQDVEDEIKDYVINSKLRKKWSKTKLRINNINTIFSRNKEIKKDSSFEAIPDPNESKKERKERLARERKKKGKKTSSNKPGVKTCYKLGIPKLRKEYIKCRLASDPQLISDKQSMKFVKTVRKAQALIKDLLFLKKDLPDGKTLGMGEFAEAIYYYKNNFNEIMSLVDQDKIDEIVRHYGILDQNAPLEIKVLTFLI